MSSRPVGQVIRGWACMCMYACACTHAQIRVRAHTHHVLTSFTLNFWPQIFFFKILFIYSWETERERQRERGREGQRHRQREKQAPCRQPDLGLDPGSPGSRPGLQAALNHWATGAALTTSYMVLLTAEMIEWAWDYSVGTVNISQSSKCTVPSG